MKRTLTPRQQAYVAAGLAGAYLAEAITWAIRAGQALQRAEYHDRAATAAAGLGIDPADVEYAVATAGPFVAVYDAEPSPADPGDGPELSPPASSDASGPLIDVEELSRP